MDGCCRGSEGSQNTEPKWLSWLESQKPRIWTRLRRKIRSRPLRCRALACMHAVHWQRPTLLCRGSSLNKASRRLCDARRAGGSERKSILACEAKLDVCQYNCGAACTGIQYTVLSRRLMDFKQMSRSCEKEDLRSYSKRWSPTLLISHSTFSERRCETQRQSAERHAVVAAAFPKSPSAQPPMSTRMRIVVA